MNCGCPHGVAVAVAPKNTPQECFLNVATVPKEIIVLFQYFGTLHLFVGCLFYNLTKKFMFEFQKIWCIV